MEDLKKEIESLKSKIKEMRATLKKKEALLEVIKKESTKEKFKKRAFLIFDGLSAEKAGEAIGVSPISVISGAMKYCKEVDPEAFYDAKIWNRKVSNIRNNQHLFNHEYLASKRKLKES